MSSATHCESALLPCCPAGPLPCPAQPWPAVLLPGCYRILLVALYHRRSPPLTATRPASLPRRPPSPRPASAAPPTAPLAVQRARLAAPMHTSHSIPSQPSSCRRLCACACACACTCAARCARLQGSSPARHGWPEPSLHNRRTRPSSPRAQQPSSLEPVRPPASEPRARAAARLTAALPYVRQPVCHRPATCAMLACARLLVSQQAGCRAGVQRPASSVQRPSRRLIDMQPHWRRGVPRARQPCVTAHASFAVREASFGPAAGPCLVRLRQNCLRRPTLNPSGNALAKCARPASCLWGCAKPPHRALLSGIDEDGHVRSQIGAMERSMSSSAVLVHMRSAPPV